MPESQGFVAVVDDEPDLLEIYREHLSERCEVKGFESPQSFLSYLENESSTKGIPQLLISDYKMPGMNGLTMIQQTQKMGFDFPFIMLSGFLTKEVVMGAVGAGVFQVLEKPVEAEVLIHAVEELLMEHEIVINRKEIRELTAQLRELYAGIRLIMDQYIPEEIQARMIVETEGQNVKKKMRFEELLLNLESRLDQLIVKEQVYLQVKSRAKAG